MEWFMEKPTYFRAVSLYYQDDKRRIVNFLENDGWDVVAKNSDEPGEIGLVLKVSRPGLSLSETFVLEQGDYIFIDSFFGEIMVQDNETFRDNYERVKQF